MQEIIGKIQELVEDHSAVISDLEQNIKDKEQIFLLKKEAVRIEGQIHILTDKLKILIKKDDRIPTQKRDEYLQNRLYQISASPSQLSSRRLAALKASTISYKETKSLDYKQAREKLFGDLIQEEVCTVTQKRVKSTASVAKETTMRLERARENIKEQIQQSTIAVNLIKEGSALLEDVADTTSNVDSLQTRAQRAMKKLKIAQNWDTLIYKFAIYFFACCCIYVIIKRITNNIITRALFKLFSYIGSFFFAKPTNSTKTNEINQSISINENSTLLNSTNLINISDINQTLSQYNSTLNTTEFNETFEEIINISNNNNTIQNITEFNETIEEFNNNNSSSYNNTNTNITDINKTLEQSTEINESTVKTT